MIATAGNYHVDPQVEHLRDAAADGGARPRTADHQSEPRPSLGEVSPRLRWITEFNNFNDGPPVWDGGRPGPESDRYWGGQP